MASPPNPSQSLPPGDNLGSPASSEMSVGFPEPCPSSVASIVASNQPVIPPSEKNVASLDACCLGVYCPVHDKFLLSWIPQKGLFLPTLFMHSTDAWTVTASRLTRTCLYAQQPDAKITAPLRHVDMYRVQQPRKAPHYITRTTYVTTVEPKNGQGCGCEMPKPSPSTTTSSVPPPFEWLSLDEIKHRQDSLAGPEAFSLLAETRDNYTAMRSQPEEDIDWCTSFNEIDLEDSLILLANRESGHSKERELLFSSRYTDTDILKLFNEFVVQCFPSQFMQFHAFRIFMAKLGWHEEESLIKAIFSAFVTAGGPKPESPLLYLTFHELLLGLAAMEERADHRGNCLRLRLKFIFNFYDDDRDGKLSAKEVTSLVADISSKKGGNPMSRFEMSRSSDGMRREMSVMKTASTDQTSNLMGEMFRQLANIVAVNETSSISEFQFTNCEDTKTIEWLAELTEPLFRSSQSTIESAAQKFAFRRQVEKASLMASQTALTRYDEACERCRETHFDLCAHGIRIDEYGRTRGTIKFDLCSDFRDVTFRQEMINDEATFNWTMQFLRYVSTINTKDSSPRPSPEGVRGVLKLVLASLQEEASLVARPFSPCFIVGEVRSNLETLYRLQTTLARWLPFVNPVNLVFLGNLIDPSEPLAADTAVYLFCLKALAPKRVTILRGPMEFQAKLPNSQLRREWLEIYEEEGSWNEVALLLDLLPVAAVVDDCLFLTKSGLPLPAKDIAQIELLSQTPKEPLTSIDSALINAML